MIPSVHVPDRPEKDEDAELEHLVMPRDPNLPATQLLELPEERPGDEAGLAFSDATVPTDDGRTLDEPGPPPGLEGEVVVLSTDWDEDVETVVDDPTKPKG